MLNHQVAQEARRETKAMKILTIIAGLAVPTTLVSVSFLPLRMLHLKCIPDKRNTGQAIFGSNFVVYDKTTRGVLISPMIWILFAASGILTFLGFILWYIWVRVVSKKRIQKTSIA
jgi:hypothetical protein